MLQWTVFCANNYIPGSSFISSISLRRRRAGGSFSNISLSLLSFVAFSVVVGGVLALAIIAVLAPVEGSTIVGDGRTLEGLAPARFTRGVGSLVVVMVATPRGTPVPVVGPRGAAIGPKSSSVVPAVVVATPITLLAIGVVAIGLGVLLGTGAGPVARLATDVTVAWEVGGLGVTIVGGRLQQVGLELGRDFGFVNGGDSRGPVARPASQTGTGHLLPDRLLGSRCHCH